MSALPVTLLVLSTAFTVMYWIQAAIRYFYRDIFSDPETIESCRHKMKYRSGFLWIPLSTLRFMFLWPVFFGGVNAVRLKKAQLLKQLNDKDGA